MKIARSRVSWLKHLLKFAPIIITLFWTLFLGFTWGWYLPCLKDLKTRFVHWDGPTWLERLELRSINKRFHWRGPIAPHPEVLIIGIDNTSILNDQYDDDEFKAYPDLAMMREWPFPRALHGKLVERLVKAGAKVVVFDLIFATQSLKGEADDATFAKSIKDNADHVVLGANFSNDRTFDWQLQLPHEALLPKDMNDHPVIGVVNYWNDIDNAIRHANFNLGNYLSLDGLAVHKAHPEIQIPKDKESVMIDFAGPAGTFPVVDYYKIFDPDHQDGSKSFYSGAPVVGWDLFKNKIILVGPMGNFQHDEHATPFGDGTYADRQGVKKHMPGVEIHANAISTLLSGVHIHELSRLQGLILILLVGGIFAVVLHRIESDLAKLLPMVIIGGCYLVGCHFAFSRFGVFLPLIPVELVMIASTLSTTILEAVLEQIEKKRVSGMFQRYVSKDVADELMKEGHDVEDLFKPRKRKVTVLFSDIRNFTTMTESNEPDLLVQQLNEYLTEMVECVFNQHGTLDKFVGDAVMAVFGNLKSLGEAEDALCGVKTALQMRERLAQLQIRWEKEGRPIFNIGIGLNYGEVMAGDIGSRQKKEFGVIGDAVNVASRVEGLNKELHTDILITDSVYELVKDHIEAEQRGDIKVKGREKPVNVYALKSLKK